MLALETKKEGYEQEFCLQCALMDKKNHNYVFDFDRIEVKGLPLDCSQSLVSKNVYFKPIPFK